MTIGSLPMPAVRHHRLETAHGALHYVEAGAGDPLLLIHGGHGAWVHWIANIDALAQGRRVIALDMPGFGQSYAPPERLPLPDYGAVVADFIRQLDLRNLAVAGFSFGTLVAATVAGLLPDVVTALTLINPPGIGERSAHALALPEELAAIARQQGLHAGVEATLKQVMLSDPALADDALISLIAGCVRHTHFETRSISRRADMLALLEKAPRNTLVLLGRQDPYHCHDLDGRRDRLNRLLGRDAVRLVDHAAHWLQYEQAAFFNRTLMDFLEAPPD